uniref:Protein kinase n=1 Tax=uncultured bacterium contig00100 TaxID=1181567 RepID=A0A806KL33_9BACT|nr:protein kinase [uncultured bacterium contig00100]
MGIKWKINLQHHTEEILALNPPVVIKDTIYFGSEDGNFYALDVESGYMRWVFKSGAEINSIPSADKEKVYFGSKDGNLYALSLKDGNPAWKYQTFSQINSQVQRYGDHIIFVGDADAIYFLNPQGQEQFYVNNPGWYHYTFNIFDNILYFGTGPRVENVGPFDINRREFLWFLPYEDLSASWYSVVAIKGDNLYMGTGNGYGGMELGYYAFNRHTGRKVWEQHIEGVFDRSWDYYMIWELFVGYVELLDFMAPAIWKNLVIFTGGDMVARAFDAKTGSLRWERAFDMPISSSPTIAGDKAYFGILGDTELNIPALLVCISVRDGKLLWQMEIEGSLLSAPVIAGKRIIFGTSKNVFYVLEQVF